ncbi:sulfite exporter TauE/SafE family protein [Streptomyces sp. SID10853]|uniref:sulfite exporter TauE/SafE family protein n=1 Tax=Streptomyces sp. SID10853 TaxID=2706028 RepID=UPI0013BF72C7|nr:sulfite exporter TauE/SafE family protein [Streptomyces sp. SID10853]NDZ78068.1 sulfite exporter TauE/SafE family protein [Streptomyces sp. SID10853]
MDTLSITGNIGGMAALAAAAMLVGFSKTAVSGANTISLAVFAAVLPARESTGVLLPVLIAGDVLAVLTYRRHAHWPTLWRLFPAVAVGVVIGTGFLFWADDAVVRTSIGAILLLMAGVTLWRRRATETARTTAAGAGADGASGEAAGEAVDGAAGEAPGGPTGGPGDAPQGPSAGRGRAMARSYGVLGGFTTMVANAGGPVMSLYLISAGFRKLGFLGTSAWFFLIVNVTKVPFSVGLGLIGTKSLLLDAALVVFVVPGAFIGRACVHRINQRLFERLVIGATVLGGVQLLLR